MKKTLSKNLKIAMIALFAVALFVSLNYCLWDNANAADNGGEANNDGSISLWGKETNWHEYTFVRGQGSQGEAGYLTDYDLDKKHNPCCENRHKSWRGFRVHGNSMTWSKIEHKDGDHPWANDDLFFGGNKTKADNSYSIKNLEFAYTDYACTNDQDDGKDCFIVNYDKGCPWNSGTQRFIITFGLNYKMNGEMVHHQTWDSFCDYSDVKYNSEILERAGHGIDSEGNDHGYTFEQAAKDVGYEDRFFDALHEGDIKVTVDKIVCQQDENYWTSYYPNSKLSKLSIPRHEWEDGTIYGEKDKNSYIDKDNNDVIKNIQLSVCKGASDLLQVNYITDPNGAGDVDYIFTVVAINRKGEIKARFRASGDAIGDSSEQIWSSDCIEGDGSIADSPSAFDGSFYVERIDVSD